MTRDGFYRGFWNKEDIKLLKRLFPNCSTAYVAHELGRPYDAVKKYASRHGLRKGRRYMKRLGRA
jgi:hypothetical protein